MPISSAHPHKVFRVEVQSKGISFSPLDFDHVSGSAMKLLRSLSLELYAATFGFRQHVGKRDTIEHESGSQHFIVLVGNHVQLTRDGWEENHPGPIVTQSPVVLFETVIG